MFVRGHEDVSLVVKLKKSNNGADRGGLVCAMRGRGLADLRRVETILAGGAAEVAMPVDLLILMR